MTLDKQTQDALLRHGTTEFWFHNPHNGTDGCAKEAPEPMRFAADFLAGEHVALANAIEVLSVHLTADSRLCLSFYDEAESHGMIRLQEGSLFVSHALRSVAL
jgi:hypothetical protein